MKTVKLYFLLVFGCSTFTMSLSAQTALNIAKMDSLLDVYEQKNKLMLSLAIHQGGNQVYNKQIGYAEVETGTKANPTTKYRVGSITKMFTSVMIQQLIEEKKLKLNTPLSKFFPKITNSKKITIEQLLQHRTGLHNFTDDAEFLLHSSTPKTSSQMLEIIYSLPHDFEPGEKYAYCNTNYVLLGYIIEKLTKRSYADALMERIVNKIGLKNTYYGTQTNVSKNEARSYIYSNRSWTVHPEWDMSLIHGSGAIVSTTEDLVKFIEALFSFQLTTQESLKQMCTLRDSYGYGMITVPFNSTFSLGHNGHWDAFESLVIHFPVENISVAYSVNGKNANINDFLIGVLSICFNVPYEIPRFYAFEVPEKVLNEYTGTYHCSSLQLDFYISKEGNIIIGQAVGQSSFPLEAVSETHFTYAPASLEIEFKKNIVNEVDQFILRQSGMEFVFAKLK